MRISSVLFGQAQEVSDALTLELGKPIKRELAGGQSHSYKFTLISHQYAHIVVEQKGINVVVTLFDPDGKPVMRIDGSSGMQGSESVHWIAEMAGSYRLEVSREGSRSTAGQYQAELLELRAATEQSRLQVAAAQASAEGDRLFEESTKASLEASIKKYEEALTMYRTLEDRNREATMLYNIGFVYRAMGEMKKALAYYTEALPLRQAGTNRGEEATTLHDIGSVYFHLGDLQTALEYFSKALPMRSEIGDKNGEAITLNDIGIVYRNLGELQKAFEYYDRVLPLRRALGDRRGEAVTLHNIGAVYQNLGEWEMALERYKQAVQLLQAVGDKHGEATSLNKLGEVYRSLGELKKAQESYNQALLLREMIGDKRGEAYTLDNIGSVYRDLGEPQKAMQYYNQALPLRGAAGDRRGEAITLNNMGDVYRDLGDLQKALEYYDQALRISSETSDRGGEAKTLRNIAFVDRAQGKLEKARVGIERAIMLVEFIRTGTGGPENKYTFTATVYDYYQFYTDLLMRMHAAHPKAGYDLTALKVSEQARARGLLELLAEAYTGIRQNVDMQLLERERSLKDRLTAKLDKLTKLLSGKYTDSEKSAAESEINTLTNEYRRVRIEIRERSPRFAALTEPQPLGVREIQQQLLDANTILLEYELGNERSYLWAVMPDRVLSYQLPPKAEVEAQARRVYQLLITRQPAPGLTEGQQRAREVAADMEYRTQATILSNMLLGPVTAQLGTKRLLIVADGALQYLPFAALPVPSTQATEMKPDPRPLILDHEIVSLPSASVLAVLRRELADRQPAPKMVAVLADPVFGPDDARVKLSLASSKSPGSQQKQGAQTASSSSAPSSTLKRALRSVRGDDDRASLRRLLFSRDEAEAILSVMPVQSGLKALDFRASRALAMSDELGQYRIIHFSTHGLLNSRHPELSGLVLSLVNEAGQPQEGFLRLHEIYNLRLNADLVVLSACQTGLGKEVRGEGLIGLTRGFMYAGAPRVMASLWQVDDAATAELMKRFYRGVFQEKLPPAAALRAAQIEMLKKRHWQSPYYWGAFVLQGEWK
jgi:CHAT domain-containing protein/Tfp pilus assembly protein PilF